MTSKPDPSERQVKERSDRLVWARRKIQIVATEMGIPISFEESERFSLLLLGLEDDEAVANKSARETHET